jgi:cytochrome c oxidase subunit 2
MISIRKSMVTGLGAAGRASAGLILALMSMPRAFAQAAGDQAQPGFVEQPHDWQFGMVDGATPVRDAIEHFHNELVVIITLITLFVVFLLAYVMVKFNAKRHPVPSTTTHNTVLEVAWTVLPVVVLFAIWLPSIRLLYYEDRTHHADFTLKVTGHQWYWSYEYPDQGDFSYDSNILSEADDAKAGKPRLLGVDNPVVVPVGATVRVLITGTDVIHSWYLPAAGVQEYAVVGHVNESWFQFEHTGTFYGQCNQICGINHPFMPIEVDVVSQDDFTKWAATAKKNFAKAGSPPAAADVKLAAAQ